MPRRTAVAPGAGLSTWAAGPARSRRATRARWVAAALGGPALVGGIGLVFAAYQGTTTNPGNSIATGTVSISDNDGADVPLYTAAEFSDVAPGFDYQRCITVTYTGSLPADVSLYATAPITSAQDFGMYVDVDSTPSSPDPACNGWGADPDSAFLSDPLGSFPTTFASGYRPYPDPWQPGESRTYLFNIVVYDDPTLNTHTTRHLTSTHTYRWEARNI